MQFEIWVDGQLLMQVRYVTDAWAFILDRRSVGKAVVVKHLPTGRIFCEDETADDIVNAVVPR